MRPPVLLLAAAVTAALLTVPPSVASTVSGTVAGTTSASSAPGCGEEHREPSRARQVQRATPSRFAAAAEANDTSVARLARLAEDDSLWLDSCGMAFYREAPVELAEDGTTSTARQAVAPPAGTDVLALESDPGAQRTIFLDVTGGSVSRTVWNSSGTITVQPYSITAPATADFSADERAAIYEAWSVVAEDFAPFAVNVTTKDPGAAAIHRSSSADLAYGTRVFLTQRSEVSTGCGCSGVAYVDVVGVAGDWHSYYQPAWVFTDGFPAGSGDVAGDIASHEVGHNFGLAHDGNESSAYHWGNALWSPVMGGSEAKRLNQWSRGEYTGATASQDDLAVIARNAPHRDDAHGDTASAAAPLDRSARGLIGRPSDVDAFSFTASGATTLTARPTAAHPNLDVKLTILDSTGAPVAVVDPPPTELASRGGSGLDATWTSTLPATPASYTALVDGTGFRTADTGYTDYGSLGRYKVTLESVVEAQDDGPSEMAPLSFVTGSRLPAAKLRRDYSERVKVAGGDGTFAWRRTGTLPRGMRTTVSSTGKAMVLSGRPRRTGRFEVRFVVTDGTDQRAAGTFTLRVRRP